MSMLESARGVSVRHSSKGANSAEVKPANAVKIWALLGLIFVGVQAYVWVRWAAEPDFGPRYTGADQVPTSVKMAAWIVQALTLVALVGSLWWVTRQVIRQRRLTFDAMLLIGWASVAWLDPVINYIRPSFFYNSYLLNLGSWGGSTPGWLSPNALNLPAPILLSGLGYMVCLLFSVGVCAAMRAAKRRFPTMGLAGLLAVAVAVGALLDFVYEVTMCVTELYAYSGTIHALSLFGGETYQFPLYEALLWGSVWGASGALRYFRDDKGRSVVERGADSISVSERGRTAIRTLAVIGFLHVIFCVYYAFFLPTTLLIDQTPPGYPSWLRNEMCGAQTDFACPGPDVPVPMNGHVIQPDPASTG